MQNSESIPCAVERVDLPFGDGRTVPGLRVICSQCGHAAESFGQRGRSLIRCLKALKEECPSGQHNDYAIPNEPV